MNPALVFIGVICLLISTVELLILTSARDTFFAIIAFVGMVFSSITLTMGVSDD